MIFVNSMSDLFHEQVPFAFIQEVFQTMAKARWHTFQILTKRAKRLSMIADKLPQAPNIWLGVSIEHQDYIRRADELRKVSAQVRFISCEPLLGPLDLDLTGINWLIVGGESGPSARPMKEEWVRSLQALSREANIPFFFKQWGGALDKRAKDKALLDGRLYKEWPSASRKLLPSKYFPRELELNLA
jgi:protein gp37